MLSQEHLKVADAAQPPAKAKQNKSRGAVSANSRKQLEEAVRKEQGAIAQSLEATHGQMSTAIERFAEKVDEMTDSAKEAIVQVMEAAPVIAFMKAAQEVESRGVQKLDDFNVPSFTVSEKLSPFFSLRSVPVSAGALPGASEPG